MDRRESELPHHQRRAGPRRPEWGFAYYQRLIRLRKAYPAIVYGAYDLILPEHEQIYAFTRTLGDERLLVILNFSREAPTFTPTAGLVSDVGQLLISNYPVDPAEATAPLTLQPYEARVYRL